MSEEKPEGPVPVRDLMKKSAEPEAEREPRWRGAERLFEREGALWEVRTVGAGAYGTGHEGTARLVAVHFFREGRPEPIREALVPAGIFPHLGDEELGELFDRATPIESER
ncbi:MAG: hypothetical protein ACOC3J_03100 [Gemmatimonadota bacterium]